MYITDIVPMPDNPIQDKGGAKTGRWKVVYWDTGDGGILLDGPTRIWKKNLTWEQAEREQIECEKHIKDNLTF